MRYQVKVMDRGSWRARRHECIMWMLRTWPGIQWEVFASVEDRSKSIHDVCIFSDGSGAEWDLYEFRDSQKAMMFKLVFG